MNLTPDQIDALKELINIGIGRAAGMLNEMVKSRVYLQVPSVRVFSILEAKNELDKLGIDRLAAVQLQFKGPFSGTAALVFPPESASNLVAVLTGEDLGTYDLDSARAGTLSEVGNIVINGVMGSVGNVLKERINYSFPKYIEDTTESILAQSDLDPNGAVLLARTRFTVKELQVEGDIILVFEVGSFDTLLASIDSMNLDSGVQS
ncbi:MAG: chemotaxis protein CheC [Desulfovibrio sp. S3730MH75]|nr:MAG: chemotaxis protein CheC [Desulfovibrio sp. S3730MH75]